MLRVVGTHAGTDRYTDQARLCAGNLNIVPDDTGWDEIAAGRSVVELPGPVSGSVGAAAGAITGTRGRRSRR